MIAVAVAEFDKETTGAQIDELARQFLKKDGCDYRHGTGHGVGSVMCVHEDGVKFSPKFLKPIVVGAVSSDEPGYYKDGEFGIRIENMLYCKELTDNKLGFETLTLVPIDLEAIELSLLTDGEKEWINNYHKNIKQTLKNYLSQEEFLWLENKYYEI
jgi:Xaa-Pro aminopeptidase